MTSEAIAGSESLKLMYGNKRPDYFSGARSDFVERLPHDLSANILEVGCGTGATGALALARSRAGRYVGIELFEAAAAEARTVLSDVVVGNVETIDLPWQPASFDAMILSEVLEHLIDPWSTLSKLGRVLRPGALVLASSPNISHWRVVRSLVNGKFDLADRGVMDRTHMRWFTPSTFAAMFERSGYQVTQIRPVTPFAPRTQMLSRLTGGRYDHLFMTQIVVEARKR